MNKKDPNLALLVRAISYQGEGISAYELVAPNHNELPPFTAGSHVDIHLPGGQIRQYSLCNDPAEHHRYILCVQREDDGLGGSKAVHDTVRVGQTVTISRPRNNFPLAPDATRHVFLAGGIGITPIMAMRHAVRATNVAWELIYCTRSPDRTAFLEELGPDIEAGRVNLHHDRGQPENSLDLNAMLSGFEVGTHLYYCGPPGFMATAADASAHWPDDAVHFEYFSVPDESGNTEGEKKAGFGATDSFLVKINSTGAVFDVPEGKSIVWVLEENGITVETSCESGLCGTCRTDYIEGEPDHRDHILSDEDKARSVLICCARSLSPMLVLDL